MDTWVISIPWLLRIMLLWTCEHRYLLAVMISFLGYPTPRPHTSSGPWPVGNQGEVSGHLPQNQSLYQNGFRYIPRGRNAGSCGRSVFSFVRKLHSGFTSLPTEQQCARVPFSTSLSPLILSDLKDQICKRVFPDLREQDQFSCSLLI